MLVYTDNAECDYRLKDCNGYEIYRIDYKYGKYIRRYEVYKNRGWDDESTLEYFNTLKEARKYARTH